MKNIIAFVVTILLLSLVSGCCKGMRYAPSNEAVNTEQNGQMCRMDQDSCLFN